MIGIQPPQHPAVTLTPDQHPVGGRNVDRTVARAEIFQTVEPSAVAGLTKHLHQVDFPRRQTVFAEGEPGDRLYIIISGKVKIGRRSPDGRDHLLTIMGPSDMLVSSRSSTRARAARARPPSRKCARYRWTANALRVWIADRPEIAEQLLPQLAGPPAVSTNNDLADWTSPTCPAASPSNCCCWRSGSAPLKAAHCG